METRFRNGDINVKVNDATTRHELSRNSILIRSLILEEKRGLAMLPLNENFNSSQILLAAIFRKLKQKTLSFVLRKQRDLTRRFNVVSFVAEERR